MLTPFMFLLVHNAFSYGSDNASDMVLGAQTVLTMKGGTEVSISVYHQRNANLSKYDPNDLIVKFNNFSRLYDSEHGLPQKKNACRSKTLKVYYVKTSYLNNADTIEYYNLPISKSSNVFVGMYAYKNYENIIMISDAHYNTLSLPKRYIHEIAHFWYAKNCNFVSDPENEHQALRIEDLVD